MDNALMITIVICLTLIALTWITKDDGNGSK